MIEFSRASPDIISEGVYCSASSRPVNSSINFSCCCNSFCIAGSIFLYFFYVSLRVTKKEIFRRQISYVFNIAELYFVCPRNRRLKIQVWILVCVCSEWNPVVNFLSWNSRSENFPCTLLNLEYFVATFVTFLRTNNSRSLNENTDPGARNLIRVYLKDGREMLLTKKKKKGYLAQI